MMPLHFAMLANEAYSAKPDIGDANSASRAITRLTDAGFCVAFPGTNNADSFAADLNAVPMLVPGAGNVHSGFWKAWQAIAAPVVAAVGDQPVTLVGHSLGAAIAICAAVALTLAGKPPAAVWCFEPPRVSSDITIRTLLKDVPVHLYKNGNDLVADLPPGWNHAGMLTYIGKPAYPFPNISDHLLANVIDSLSAIQ